MLLLTFASTIHGVNVDATTYLYKDFATFNYVISFDGSDSVDKFSFEKPRDSKLNYIVDKNGKIPYSEAGDYYIITPSEIQDNTFIVNFKSEKLSKELFKTDSFRTYLNFNMEVSELSYKLVLKDDFGEIVNIYPQDYNLRPNGEIQWTSQNVNEDSLYIVNFKDVSNVGKESIDYLFIAIIAVPIILLGIGFFILFKKYKKLEKGGKNIIKAKNDTEKPSIENDEKPKSPKEENTFSNEDMFYEIVNKHLTENEKEVVLLIKENEGISQYDILNFIPKLTKSNLSKIISKLHSKKILKRIKVGKVNHIYLGDKLSSYSNQNPQKE